ncbi:DUF5055 domain-containing protein [Colidextribacter sp. OB.20]|uniref:DUF5055 domain-containing protein n=1 Tax=Colidextribacter sp. OB.20 TaxID=2304568 RepID=UPI00136A44D2|nr:DUF5055 domain-containing protein [Colidextribacter sp. OB.20]NBI10256.1 DUF5055 domain-containing protein [Colidextribacter sp. OB.20]
MSEKAIAKEEKINPIRLTDNNGIIKNPGDVYELDFSRESVVYAESRGFKLEDVPSFPVTGIANLFFYSFRKNHKSVAREKVDKLREAWGGIPESVLNRLFDLYNQAATANTIQVEEGSEKNGAATVEM